MTTFLWNLLLNNSVTQWRRFRGILGFFFRMFACKKWNWFAHRQTPIFFLSTNKYSFESFCSVCFGVALRTLRMKYLLQCRLRAEWYDNSVIGSFACQTAMTYVSSSSAFLFVLTLSLYGTYECAKLFTLLTVLNRYTCSFWFHSNR